MQSKSLISAFIFLMIPFIGMGQWYNSSVINRPGGLNWQELKTDHFRIIFPEGADSIAYISAAILESQYAKASTLTGGTLKNFPVILRDYNDLSNGFVTSLNFRSEVDIAALKGKSMNPQTGNWLETVLPHELIHAAHFNVQQPLNEKKVSFSNAISLFSPDLARSIHGFPPVGIHEGLAVYHESEAITPMGGRGNYTHFTNRFNANFGSSDRWNMGQTLIPSDYSRPLGRHYISGYQFVDWLQEEYGEDISRNAIRYHYHNFFLGYGFALRQKTGKWPRELYEAYEKANRQKEHERLAKIQGETTDNSTILDFHFKGEEAHSPKWINHEELLFYASFYNGRLGFYRMDLKDEQPSLLIETFSVNDFNYEIENHSKLYFSSYKRDLLYPSTFKTDLFTYDFNTAKRERLTYDSRIYAPTTNGQVLLGIKIEGGNAEIVQVDEKSGESSILKQFGESTPKALRFNPKNPEKLAVVFQKRGVQALWITTLQTMEQDLEKEPDVAFSKGSIFDPEWHPDGTKVLFTMDAQPAMNIFEYDLISGEILQLTSSAYNAMEASYSPDGSKIAYVLQVDDERKIALLDRDHFFNKPVNKESLWSGQELSKALNRPLLGYDSLDSIKTISPTPYKSNINWLTPRSVFPVIEEKGGTYQYGAAVSSIDALSSQAYTLQLTGIQDRLWYDFTYTNKMFYPGFELNAYSDPQFFVQSNPNTQQPISLMQQSRGFGLSIPFNYVFRGDTRLSSLSVSPELKAEQIKYYNLTPNALSDFSTRYRGGLFSQLNLGVLNLPRDVQPSSGVSIFSLYESTLNEPSLVINYPGGSPVKGTFGNQWTVYYGIFGFISPLRRWNQSLRLDLRFLQQSTSPIYSNNTIIPLGFDRGDFPNYNSSSNTGFQNIARFSTRYTIPLLYPDNGVFTVPAYLSSVYLTNFTHTLTNMDANDLVESSRTIIGAGFHVQFKVSNLLFDLGIGLAYEPSQNNTEFIIGQF